MSFLNVDALLSDFSDDLMVGNLERLKTFDAYHCLRKATISSTLKAQNYIVNMSPALAKWVRYCDGGLLFDTVLLSSKEHDSELDLDFDTFDDYNSAETKAEMGLPEEYVVIGVRSYGDPICVSTEKGDEKVYIWSLDNQAFDGYWDTFEDWMTDEIDTAIQLIAEDSLEPLEIKLGDE